VLENIRRNGQAERADFVAITTLLEVAADTQTLLETTDGDLYYRQIDREQNENNAHTFLASLDVAVARRELAAELVKCYKEQMTRTAAEVEFIRARKDNERKPGDRLSDLRQKQAAIAEMQNSFDNVSGILGISDTALDVQVDTLTVTIDRAVAPLQVFMKLQLHPDMCTYFVEQLQTQGLLNAADKNLAEISLLSKLKRLVADLGSYPDTERSLKELGFLNTKMPKFGAGQKDRIKQVVTDLLAGDGTYLSKGLVTVPESIPAAPVAKPAAATAPEPAKAAAAPAPTLARGPGSHLVNRRPDFDPDDDGVDMGDIEL